MKLRDYLKEQVNKRISLDADYVVDVVNVNTGEIYFSGKIDILSPELISDNLIFESFESEEEIQLKLGREANAVIYFSESRPHVDAIMRDWDATIRVVSGELETYDEIHCVDPETSKDVWFKSALMCVKEYISDLRNDHQPSKQRMTKLRDIWDDFGEDEKESLLEFIDFEDLDCELMSIQGSIATNVLLNDCSIETIARAQKWIKRLDTYEITTTKEEE